MNMKNVWYSNKANITSPDTVHQVLMYGDLKEIRSLKKALGGEKMKKLFLSHPKKVYTAPALNFIKNFVLQIPTQIDEQKYLKSTPRNIG